LRARRDGIIREAEEAVTVGFYSPLPPANTGVAGYSAALLAQLKRRGSVKIAPNRCDAPLYHLGNNGLHAPIYRRALERPGVIVLHDAVLHHFLLGQLDEKEYTEEFVYNYGEWSRGLARDLWRDRAGSASDPRYFRYPMLKRMAERAAVVVVHNPAAFRAVKAHAPRATVVEIPHLFAAPGLPTQAEAERYRQRLGIAPAAFLFGVFGYLRESKRLFAVLDAFERLRGEKPLVALLVAGRFVSPQLERAIQPALLAPGVIRRPYLGEREFWLAARAVDACINLRYPAAGETSGIAVRFMGIGKAVLVTDSEECARYPEDGCVRIASGLAERESLWRHMLLLTSMPEVSGVIGERAAEHIRAHHGIERIAKEYWKVLSEHAS
jgi:glycosyltransferase involved in cell wall biosynthesis